MEDIISIDNHLECFFTGRLVDMKNTSAEYRVHNPVRRETVMVHDELWEGSTSVYHVIIKDVDIYRMYYREEAAEKAEQHGISSCAMPKVTIVCTG